MFVPVGIEKESSRVKEFFQALPEPVSDAKHLWKRINQHNKLINATRKDYISFTAERFTFIFFLNVYTSESSLNTMDESLGGHLGEEATLGVEEEAAEGMAMASRLLRKESLSRLYMSSGKVS